MTIKFKLSVGRYRADGQQESTVYSLPLKGQPLVEFSETPPQRDRDGRRSTMRYFLFNNGVKGQGGYGLLTLGEDMGVPTFAYRYAVDHEQLAELFMADGVSADNIHKVEQRLKCRLSMPSKTAETELLNVMNRLARPPAKKRWQLPALLRPKPKGGSGLK